jgi:hypothetical protein
MDDSSPDSCYVEWFTYLKMSVLCPHNAKRSGFFRPIFSNRLRLRFTLISYNYQSDSKVTNTPTNFDQVAFRNTKDMMTTTEHHDAGNTDDIDVMHNPEEVTPKRKPGRPKGSKILRNEVRRVEVTNTDTERQRKVEGPPIYEPVKIIGLIGAHLNISASFFAAENVKTSIISFGHQKFSLRYLSGEIKCYSLFIIISLTHSRTHFTAHPVT